MVRLKRKLSAWLIASLILGVWSRDVQADDRVVLLEDARRPNSGLIAALQIQLTGVAELDVRQEPDNPGVSGRVQVASRLAQADDVLLVTWAEPAVELGDGSREAVLYVVGHKQGRALLEVVRVPGGEGPEVERSLALKLREVVEEIRSNRAQAAAADVMLEAAPEPEEPEPAAGWDIAVAVAGAVGPLSGSDLGQWGARMSAGPAWRSGALRLAGMLQVTVFPQVELARGASRVRFYEIGPGLLLRAQLRQGLFWFGVRAGPQLSWVKAEGESATRAGEANELTTSLLVGAEVELPIDDGVGIAAGVDLEAHFKRQHFTVEGERVVDLGRLRPVASIALTWNGPAVR